jgi:hypothetical protein
MSPIEIPAGKVRSMRRVLSCAVACGALLLLSAPMVGVLPGGQAVAGPGGGGGTKYNLYFGDLHNHTSYSDGVGTPRQAYAAAIAAGADFMAVTEHDSYGFWITPEEWADMLAAAAEFTSDRFVAMAGIEFWLAGSGEINIFNTPNTPDVPRDPAQRPVPGSMDAPFESLPAVYDWIAREPGAVGQWNHPTYVTNNFFNFDFYTPERDRGMGVIEVWNDTWFYTEDSYRMALDRGWRVMPAANADTHAADWIAGWELRTVLLAPRLTPADLYAAMSAGRGYATVDRNLRVRYTVNGEVMGSVLSPTTTKYAITLRAEDPDGLPITRLEIISDGGAVVASRATNGAAVEWSTTLSSATARYFYARIRSASSPHNVLAQVTGGGGVAAVTAPVFTGR